MKAQAISMDFTFTFLLYMFVLSTFFFMLNSSYAKEEPGLDISAELLFNRLDVLSDQDLDFLDGARVNDSVFAEYNTNRDASSRALYHLALEDFASPVFSNMSFCIYLEDDGDVEVNIAAYEDPAFNNIEIDTSTLCGANPLHHYANAVPQCNALNPESIVLTKPVVHDGEIVNLKVLICADKYE